MRKGSNGKSSKQSGKRQCLASHLLQKITLDMVQLGRKIYVDLMRICKTFRFIPERVFFSDTDIADFHNRRRSVDTYTVFEYRNEHFPQCVGATLDFCFFPRFKRIKDDQIFGRIIRFICQTDQIGTNFAGLLVVDTKNFFVARVSDFFRIFGKLDFRDKFTGLSSRTAASL